MHFRVQIIVNHQLSGPWARLIRGTPHNPGARRLRQKQLVKSTQTAVKQGESG